MKTLYEVDLKWHIWTITLLYEDDIYWKAHLPQPCGGRQCPLQSSCCRFPIWLRNYMVDPTLVSKAMEATNSLIRQHCGLIIHEYSWIGRRQCYLSLMSLNSRKCVTTDIDLDSFTEWWRYIIWWNLTIWCWSIICWFFIFYIISSHKTKITLLYKKINFMTFQHMMTFHHIPYDGLSTS